MKRQWDARTVALVWDSKRPMIDGVEGKVRSELQSELDGLAHPSDLVFHLIWLEDDPDGPTVMAYGREGSDAIHLEYDDDPTWVTIEEAAHG